MTELLNKIKKTDNHLIISYLVLATGLLLVVIRQYELLSYLLFGDETETIVAGKMIAAGSSLYSEIFNHHGPLIFLPSTLLGKIGDFGIIGHRVIIVLLQWLMLAAVYFSPLIKNTLLKNYLVLSIAFYVVIFLPNLYGHMFIYQVVAGILTLILLVQYVLPAIFIPDSITKTRQITGNLLIASLPFFAITYILLSLFLFLASVNKINYKNNLKYLFYGFLLNIGFILLIGSLYGYIADHFYMNIKIIPEFTGSLTVINKAVVIYDFFTSDPIGFLFFLSLCLVLIKASFFGNKWILINIIFVLLGIISLLFRNTGGFHTLPFYYAIIIIPIVLFTGIQSIQVTTKTALLLVTLPFLIKLSLVFGIDKDKIRGKSIPITSEFSELVKELTNPDDKIIAYTFSNHEYIFSERLPASGNFFYFPWQKKYTENPILGINIDTCLDIRKTRPKVMYIDKWNIWGKFTWNSYASCIQDITDKDYVKINLKPYYIRKDIYNKLNSLHKIIPAAFTDLNWENGISKNLPALIIENNIKSRISLTKGNTLEFQFSGKRTITDIKYSAHYINIYISGDNLNPVEDGYPHKVKINSKNVH